MITIYTNHEDKPTAVAKDHEYLRDVHSVEVIDGRVQVTFASTVPLEVIKVDPPFRKR